MQGIRRRPGVHVFAEAGVGFDVDNQKALGVLTQRDQPCAEIERQPGFPHGCRGQRPAHSPLMHVHHNQVTGHDHQHVGRNPQPQHTGDPGHPAEHHPAHRQHRPKAGLDEKQQRTRRGFLRGKHEGVDLERQVLGEQYQRHAEDQRGRCFNLLEQ
ncbi:hypothetical protein D3C80_1356700 [compost metagenome]